MKKATPLVVVCGWPLSGKTTLATQLQAQLNYHLIDIDQVRRLATGLPYPHPNESAELMKRDGQEMKAAYGFMLNMTDWHLDNERPLIITATFSRKSGQEDLRSIYEKHSNARPVILWCKPEQDDDAEIQKRLARGFGGSYVGGVNSLERYKEVKDRYDPIELPHLLLDTSREDQIGACIARAMAKILRSLEPVADGLVAG